MAENWADLPDPLDTQPEDQTEADANRDLLGPDNADDGTKPKRNRIPTITNNDDIIDDNGDDAPKPKRGRGRPKKDEDTQLVITMRKDLEELRSENSRLANLLRICTADKEDVERDLELTRSSLLERENDYSELLEQLSAHEENHASQDVIKPNGIVFYDDITEPCISKLKSAITWRKVKKGLEDIDIDDDIKSADIVLLVTGSCEIASGASAFKLHQILKRLINTYSENTVMYLASLPPNNSARVQIDLFNHKLCNIEGKNIHTLKVKFIGTKLDLVNFNGSSPSPKCIALYDDIVQSIIVPTEIKSKATAPSDTQQLDFTVTAMVPIKPEHVGRIIGKNGNVIKRITTANDVRISFGSWSERNSDSRDDDSEPFTAATVKGQATHVQMAISQITEIVKAKPNK